MEDYGSPIAQEAEAGHCWDAEISLLSMPSFKIGMFRMQCLQYNTYRFGLIAAIVSLSP
jgi:hypothetical protein